jgi:hypothetical protein
MTDYEILTDMFNRSGIVFEIPSIPETVIVVREDTYGPNEKTNKGYSGFYTAFEFDENKKLTSMGAFE